MQNKQVRRPPGTRYPKELQEEAISEVITKRRTICAVAGQLGLHPRTLGRWVAERKGAPEPIAPAPARQSKASANLPSPPRGLRPSGDSLIDARAVQARLLQAAHDAEQLGAAEESRRCLAESVKVSAVIARLEAERAREEGAVIASPAEIAAARQSVLAKIAELRAVPLRCECCGKVLTIASREVA